MKPISRIVAGQPAWIVENSSVRAAITEQGAMMAPVEFSSHGHAPIRPYYLSPWQESDEMPANPVHVPLRGEFFCLPFGAATEREGVRYPQHGEPAAQLWTLGSYERSEGVTRFSAEIGTTAPRGRVAKKVTIIEGHPVVYTEHTLEGFAARTPLGHHAILAADPDRKSVV